MVQQKEDESPPLVYGLATVYSATVISVASFTYLLLCMLLGDGLAPSLSLQALILYILLELHTSYMSSPSQGNYNNPTWPGWEVWRLAGTVQ